MGPRMRNWSYEPPVYLCADGTCSVAWASGSDAQGRERRPRGAEEETPKEGSPFCPFRGGGTWSLSVAGSLTGCCFLLRRLSLWPFEAAPAWGRMLLHSAWGSPACQAPA